MGLIKVWENNWKILIGEDIIAKQKGVLVGRYIKEQYADGYAFYKITKEIKKKVMIEVVKNIGDDWVIPYWGEKKVIDKEYALHSITGREALEKIFGGKQ